MIIQLEKQITAQQLGSINSELQKSQIKTVDIKTQYCFYKVAVLSSDFDMRRIGNFPGVKDIHRVTDAYKLVSKKWKVQPTTINLGNGVEIGQNDFTLMAGPCSIESESQIEAIVSFLLEKKVKIMRGGVFKPRTSPYAFRGFGIESLKVFYNICRKNGIKIITEVMDVSQIEMMIDYVDIFQVGARNNQNFNLLDALGKVDKPVLIKRGISGSIDELLQSAEYVFSSGNEKIMLCERGIRTFEKAYRNTLDINAIPILKEKSHLPVIVDPSHGIGIRKHVSCLTLAAMFAGADGALIEVHQEPEKAISDGQQSLNFEEFSLLVDKINEVKKFVN